jgi:hypothetical protein
MEDHVEAVADALDARGVVARERLSGGEGGEQQEEQGGGRHRRLQTGCARDRSVSATLSRPASAL